MRILQIGKYPKEYRGGIEAILFSLSVYLAIDNKVEVVCGTREKCREEKVSENLTFRYFPIWTTVASAPIIPSLIAYLKKAKDFDIIQVTLPNPFAVLAYLIANPPGKLIVWYHYDIVGRLLGRILLYPFSRRFLRKADCIVVSSEKYKQTSKVLKDFKAKTIAIPHGINVSEFISLAEKEKSSISRKEYGSPLVLFVGRLVYYKGVKYLIRAMQDVNAHLLIIGYGILESKIKGLVCKLKLNNKVSFRHVPIQESIIAYMLACDVFVLPSIYRSEAFGVVLLEAMASGKPVVTTELRTGTSFACQNGVTGLVVPPKNPAALAAAINRILCDQEFAKKLGEAGERRVEENFTLKKMGESFLELYRKLLAKGS